MRMIWIVMMSAVFGCIPVKLPSTQPTKSDGGSSQVGVAAAQATAQAVKEAGPHQSVRPAVLNRQAPVVPKQVVNVKRWLQVYGTYRENAAKGDILYRGKRVRGVMFVQAVDQKDGKYMAVEYGLQIYRVGFSKCDNVRIEFSNPNDLLNVKINHQYVIEGDVDHAEDEKLGLRTGKSVRVKNGRILGEYQEPKQQRR